MFFKHKIIAYAYKNHVFTADKLNELIFIIQKGSHIIS